MCNSAALTNITKKCGVNVAGFKQEICITFEEEIATIPAPGANSLTVSGDITFRAAQTGPPAVAAGSFRTFSISAKDQDLQVEAIGSEDNPAGYKTNFKFRILSNDAATLYSISATAGAPMIAVLKHLATGKNRIIGELNNACYLKVMEKETANEGYLDCELIWEKSAERPLFYTGALPN